MIGKKFLLIGAVLSSMLLVAPVFADEEKQEGKTGEEAPTLPLTASFSLTSNYIFRGVSQTNNTPAVQGGFTYTVPNWGVYANIWASNVYFYDLNLNTATIEVDTVLGIANTIKENFSYNLYWVRYNYPKTVGLAYSEYIASAQLYFLTGLVGYSNDVYNLSDHGTYYNVGINYDIPPQYIFGLNEMNLVAGIGRYNFSDNLGPLYHLNSYTDYKIQLSKTVGNYNLALAWTDTSIGRQDLPNFLNPLWSDNKVVFTLTANIE